PMVADAARRIHDVDPDAVIASDALRRAGFQAAAALLVLGIVAIASRHAVRQAVDAGSPTLFPSGGALEGAPGNAPAKAGDAPAIQARLVGNSAPVAAQLQIANRGTGAGAGDASGWRASDMTTEAPGNFRASLNGVATSFQYRVVAGSVTSPAYTITVVRPPRVARIDVEYVYPAALNLKPRMERDGGDIYAPAGTDVRLRVVTDPPAPPGTLPLANGRTASLAAAGGNEMSVSLTVSEDTSYRVALADREGMSNPGDTEYFIRALEDRAPDVRVLKPASDKSVTALEEVEIAAQAEDDYGIDRLDLVYAVRGGEEQVVPIRIPRSQTTVDGHHTMFLEDLDVHPGDFISYYVRARDLTRGTRSNEARSDIFFLEVKPYEQEFSLAQSQSSASGGGGPGSIDDPVAAQKEVIVAPRKLDRRAP